MSPALARLLKSTSSRSRPWQVALAAAVGILCGLLPKASVLFTIVAGIAFLLPLHLLVCVATTLVFTAVADFVAPAAGRLGMWSLTASPAADFWMRIDALPLVPWLGLHNTAVHGSLLIGLFFSMPCFVIALSVVRNLYGPHDRARKAKRVLDRDRDHELVPWVAPNATDFGSGTARAAQRKCTKPFESGRAACAAPLPQTGRSCEVSGIGVAPHSARPRPELEPNAFQPLPSRPAESTVGSWEGTRDDSLPDIERPVNSADSQSSDALEEGVEQSEVRLIQLMGESAADRDSDMNGEDVLRRAQKMTELMDELLSTMDDPSPTLPLPQETTAQAGETSKRSEIAPPREVVDIEGMAGEAPGRQERGRGSKVQSIRTAVPAFDPRPLSCSSSQLVSYVEEQHEESLRYLLQHLKECQSRVRREW